MNDKIVHMQSLRLGNGGTTNIWLPRSVCGHWYVDVTTIKRLVTCKKCLAFMLDPTVKRSAAKAGKQP